MGTVTSRDGTKIAYDRLGSGPAVILVDGALVYRANWGLVPLAEKLADQLTVFTYDRRGRGESGDTLPYALEKEIEDIDALIEAAGGRAFVYGISSGAALALEMQLQLGERIQKLALYEPPYNADPIAREQWKEYSRKLNEVLQEGRKGDAVAIFMQLTGARPEDVEGMRQAPIWPLFEAVGHTLAYDAAAMGEEADVPVERARNVNVPVLVIAGGASYPFMQETAKKLAEAMPQGQLRILEGQTHEVSEDVLAPVLEDFFG